ncbi:MAG: transposase [Isosphaeraceae bacterium]|nr:transposase [Isosphaeraceae bacterium]
MTDCNNRPLGFARLGSRQVVADCRGGRLTTDAGALLLRETARQLGLFEVLNAVIPDPRQPELITQEQQTMLAQWITAIALGYEDLNDHQTLRTDPALQLAAGQTPAEDEPWASPPTLCRLENRIDHATSVRMAVLVDQFLAAHREPPEHLILDVDATDDPVHGPQERRFSSSTAIMIITASCPYTSSAAMSCWWRICAPATSTRRSTPARS